MHWVVPFAVTIMLLFPAGQEPHNPWKSKVADAVTKAERSRTIAAYRQALDVVWRADDWQAGLELAHAAHDEYPSEPTLIGLITRALWRGGEIDAAERTVDMIDEDTRDRVSLRTSIEIQLARGRTEKAHAAARLLEKLGPTSAMEYYQLLAVRLAEDRLAGLAAGLRKAAELVDPEHGYPEIFLA